MASASRIVVTGATGYLGTALVGALRARGDEVLALGSRACDLTKAGSLDEAAPGTFDMIFHLAAWTQAGDFCLKHPGEQWVINQRINTNTLEWWARAQPRAKLISIGTSCAYPKEGVLKESRYLDGEPEPSLFTYAMTKRMLLVGQAALQKQYGLSWASFVPSTLYGPGYHTDGRQLHFIFDLIRKILRGVSHGDEVVLWGDGHQRRELVFIDDFLSVMLKLSDSATNELVNIGAGEDHSIRNFAGMIAEEVGYDPNLIRYDTTKYVGSRSKRLDVEKLGTLLPGHRFLPLREGLARTIAWMREHQQHFVGTK